MNFKLTEVADATLSGDVEIHNKHFIRCAFVNARLIYKGGVPPILEECVFQDSEIVFEAQAAFALETIRNMIAVGLEPVIAPMLGLSAPAQPPVTKH